MFKHSVKTKSVFFIVPKFTPQAMNLTLNHNADKFVRKFEEEFGDRGVSDVMVCSSGAHDVQVSMTLHPYSLNGADFVFFSERGLDMHFDNFYNRYPFDK